MLLPCRLPRSREKAAIPLQSMSEALPYFPCDGIFYSIIKENWSVGCCPPFRKGIIMSVSHLIRRLRGASFRKCVLAVCCIAVSFPSAGDESAAEARRAKLLSRPRRVIFNNDGCEMFFMPLKEPLIENFLKLRHTGLLDKKVDVISYCATATAFSPIPSAAALLNIRVPVRESAHSGNWGRTPCPSQSGSHTPTGWRVSGRCA